MSAIEALAGRLTLRPGRNPSVSCERPMVGAQWLGRLTQGRRAALLPDLLGSLFTLCSHAHRQTARRAVLAACGRVDTEADRQRDALAITVHTAREHLQRLAIDWPRLAGCASPAADAAQAAAWLRDAPVSAAFSGSPALREAAWRGAAAALPCWLERRLFGIAPSAWLARWHADAGAWLEQWSARHDHPVTQVLRSVRERALATRWPGAALDVPERGTDGWRALAAAIDADPGFASRPVWRGAPAETGPWTRQARPQPVSSAWERLGARLADLAQIAEGAGLACGALRLAPGEAIAWSEMSRGLLVHWLRLEGGGDDLAVVRVQRVQVLAPTDWNFHAGGAFGHWLAERRADDDGPAVRLAAMALDPCLDLTIEPAEVHDA